MFRDGNVVLQTTEEYDENKAIKLTPQQWLSSPSDPGGFSTTMPPEEVTKEIEKLKQQEEEKAKEGDEEAEDNVVDLEQKRKEAAAAKTSEEAQEALDDAKEIAGEADAAELKQKAEKIANDFKKKVSQLSSDAQSGKTEPTQVSQSDLTGVPPINEEETAPLSEDDVEEMIAGMVGAVREMHRVYGEVKKIKNLKEFKGRTLPQRIAQEFMAGERTKEEKAAKYTAKIIQKILQGKTETLVNDPAATEAPWRKTVKINPLSKEFFNKFQQFWYLLHTNKLVEEFRQIVRSRLKEKPTKSPASGAPVLKVAAERLEKNLEPLVRSVMRELNGKEKLRN
jgi:hypothetical protein